VQEKSFFFFCESQSLIFEKKYFKENIYLVDYTSFGFKQYTDAESFLWEQKEDVKEKKK
jgi:hypothetical protein